MSADLRLGDCLGVDGLATLADKSVDVMIFDAPYSEHVHASCRSGLTASNKAVRNHDDKAQISQRKELGFESITQDQIEAVADEAERLVKRWVIAFSDVESCHLWRGAFTSAGLEYGSRATGLQSASRR